MIDSEIVTHTRNRNLYELTIECHAHENAELRERLAERDRDVAGLSETLRASVAQLHASHVREHQQRQVNRRLRVQVESQAARIRLLEAGRVA